MVMLPKLFRTDAGRLVNACRIVVSITVAKHYPFKSDKSAIVGHFSLPVHNIQVVVFLKFVHVHNLNFRYLEC